jgi:ABC-type bacteriocin/lantibiotic exporter with double-glycine peptidase domain
VVVSGVENVVIAEAVATVQVVVIVVAAVAVVARAVQIAAVAQQVDADNNIVLDYFNKYCNNVTTKKIKTS